jgi:hypothetical protein
VTQALTPAQLYQKAWYQANKETVKQRSREWSAANKDRKAAVDKAYRAANPERMLANASAWAAKNPEKRKAIYTKYRFEKIDKARANEAAYRARNRDACNARVRAWKSKNPHKLAHYFNKRKAAELSAMPAWADLDAMEAVYAEAQRIQAETGVPQHVDHVVPILSKLVCGLHCEANLEVIPASVNTSKQNRYWPDMP